MFNDLKFAVAAIGVMAALAPQAAIAQPAGDIDLLTWLGGPDREVLDALVAGFEAQHPELRVNINVTTSQGDARISSGHCRLRRRLLLLVRSSNGASMEKLPH